MTLYYSPTSPYARKVLVLAHEAGIAGKLDIITGSGTPLDSGQAPIAQNPLGKVPTLSRPDGPAIYDSRVICEYLDSIAQSGFYPGGARRWDALTLQSMADGILDAALAMVYESRLRPEAMHFAPFVEGQWQKIARSVDMLETRWISYLAGPFCIGQIATACALSYLDLRHNARNWRQAHPALTAWHENFAQRDSMLATQPPT
ncbi:glutathione S-transferase [Roseinatronobacter alkalisoli]|uniref:Glutathione S-transferase n=1 Tax=Roseinatronobacter alkalisoli TaxID=3028235 RepID=A0ABT5TAD9_9RHOB|nr:glutathione S-transferase [Roseinatronobacter sp. HJB301]MDD7972088.1 glutathione S-transferase [Roseinatronobacter sp. HJB301]